MPFFKGIPSCLARQATVAVRVVAGGSVIGSALAWPAHLRARRPAIMRPC